MASRKSLRHQGIVVAVIASGLILKAPGSGALPMAPYLQAVTANSVYVLVESDTTQPVTVEYGATTAYGSKAATGSTEPTDATPATHVHNVKLTGLKPNTTYNYRVTQGGASSANHTFVTAAEPGTSFRFAWLADCRTQPAVHDEIAGRIREMQPRFSLYGGDLCERSTYEYWKREFFVANQLALVSGVPFFNAAGNHEGWSTNTKAFTQSPESPSGVQEYYSFDYGDAHFVCVNNELPYGPGSPQYDFLARDLSTTRKTWKIVFAHRPAFGLGGNGEDLAMKLLTTYIFEPCRVDMVIAGHNHSYQHSLVNGIHHMLIGSAGAPLVSPGTGMYTIKSAFDYNFAVTDVSPTILKMVVYNAGGTVLETITLEPKAPQAGTIVLPTPPPPLPPIVDDKISKNSTWKFYAGGKEPDPSWKERTFNDSNWTSGNGPLGFGLARITTRLPAGRMTYYLRKTFTLGGNAAKFTRLTLFADYNDGFVLYLDGQEIVRSGLPAGAVTYDTPAVAHAGGSYEAIDLTDIVPTLTKGLHLFAVEVHQKNATSGDLIWDAQLVSELPAA